jgi:hypothetical protein
MYREKLLVAMARAALDDDFERRKLIHELLPEIKRAQEIFDKVDGHFNRDTRPYDLCDDLRCTLERIRERLMLEVQE